MVKIKTVWGRVFPPSDSFIIVAAIILCCLLLIPNGLESRVQRFGNLHIAAVFCVGLYAMRLNWWAGAILAYSALLMTFTVSEMPIITTMLILGILFVFVSSTDINKEAIYNTICVVALANVLWQVLQYNQIFLINIPFKEYQLFRFGLMSNTNETSALLAISLPCFFRKKWVLCIPAIILGLFLAIAYNGILAAVLVSLLFGIIKLRGRYRILIITVCVSLPFIFMGFIKPAHNAYLSLRVRAKASSASLDASRYSILFGWGIGQFKYVFPLVSAFKQLSKNDSILLLNSVYNRTVLSNLITEKRSEDGNYFAKDRVSEVFLELHCEPLEWLFNAGIVGFILLIGGLLTALLKGFREKTVEFYGLLASCLCSMWFFPWHIIPTAFISVVYYGMISNKRWQNGSTFSAHTR